MTTLPLYRLFNALRQQAHIPLGIDDYLVALEAMKQGYGLDGREALSELCQVLWITSEPQRALFLSLFNEIYPPPDPAKVQPPTDPKKPVGKEKTPDSDKKGQEPPSDRGKKKDPGSTTEKGSPLPQDSFVTDQQLQTVVNLADVDEVESFIRSPRPDTALSETVRFSLGQEFLPVTARQMQQSFRRLRKAVREGPADELDVEKTVDDVARRGILLELVLRPRRVNRASLFLLVDQGGSMAPFHPLSRRLVETAERGSRLQTMSAYYFRNYPGNYLYSDTKLINETAVDRILTQIARHQAGVLVFSDAGAARGFYNKARVNWTYYFINQLRRYTRHITWLNPVPEDRWDNTSAAAIKTFVKMYAISHQGMEQAVGALRG